MFGRKCSIIGVVHVPPLPGSANYGGDMSQILASSLFDALNYKDGGVDAIIVENMHDLPYSLSTVSSETVAAMTIIVNAIKYETMLPVGVQILAGANLEALAVAIACEARFIRVEGYVYAHVGDEGLHESCAHQLVKQRAYLKGNKIKIFADIKKKHSSHAITEDISLVDTAKSVEFFLGDGVIVTGKSTGISPLINDVQDVKQNVNIPVIVGSGVNMDNIIEFSNIANALIVGTAFKKDYYWANPVSETRVKKMVSLLKD